MQPPLSYLATLKSTGPAARCSPTVGCRFCRSQALHREQMSPNSEGQARRRTRCQAWWRRSRLSWRTPKSPLARDPETCGTHPGAEPSGARTLSSGNHLDTCVSLTCSLSRPGETAADLSKFAIRSWRPGSSPTLTRAGYRRRLRVWGPRSRVGVAGPASAVPGRGSLPWRSLRLAAERLRQEASSGQQPLRSATGMLQ